LEEIKNCSSGKELIEKGFEKNIDLAVALDASDSIPLLTGKCYIPGINLAR
jgi:2-phosphosulfolactate phosphatase